MKILYFSGTGNSLSVAKKIAGENGKLIPMSTYKDNNINTVEDDIVGFVYPCYAFQSPKYVYDFVKKLQIKAQYIFIVGTNGGGSGYGVYDIYKLLTKKGYHVNYCDEISMVSNYLPFTDMKEAKSKFNLEKFSTDTNKIISNINDRKDYIIKKSFAFKLFAPIIKLIKPAVNGNVDKNYYVDESCTKCSICAKVCPTNNIVVNDKVQFNHNCTYCFACIQNCPTISIHHKKEKNSERYRCLDIKLEEMIIESDK